MSFTSKRIDVQFALANGQFEGGGNTKIVQDLRASCHILNTGGPMAGKMEMAIWGVSLSDMNQLVTTGTDYLRMYKNQIDVMVGDDAGMNLIWHGAIVSAMFDAQKMPDVCLRVLSLPTAFDIVTPAKPLSVEGSADAAGLIQQLAQQMGFAFENTGVSAKLMNPYYGGSTWGQAVSIARDGGFDLVVDRDKMCAVAPDQTRVGSPVLIAPQVGGLIGYPLFDQTQINLRALYNPQVQYYGAVQVESSVLSARGSWKVNQLEYILESQMPSGHWEMAIQGVQIGPTVP